MIYRRACEPPSSPSALADPLDERCKPDQPLRPRPMAARGVEGAGFAGVDEFGAPVGGERGDGVIGALRIVAARDHHARPGQGCTRRCPVRARKPFEPLRVGRRDQKGAADVGSVERGARVRDRHGAEPMADEEGGALRSSAARATASVQASRRRSAGSGGWTKRAVESFARHRLGQSPSAAPPMLGTMRMSKSDARIGLSYHEGRPPPQSGPDHDFAFEKEKAVLPYFVMAAETVGGGRQFTNLRRKRAQRNFLGA